METVHYKKESLKPCSHILYYKVGSNNCSRCINNINIDTINNIVLCNFNDDETIPLKVVECYASLITSIQQAGGAISGFDIKRLKSISAFDLVGVLGINNIKFKYKGNDNV